MKQLPALARRDELQSAHFSRLRILLIEVYVSQHFFYFLIVCWSLLIQFSLIQLHFLLVGSFQAFGYQIFRNKLRDHHFAVIDFLPQVIYGLHQVLSIAFIAFKLLFQLRRLQQLLLEVQRLEKIHLVIVQICPDIINPIPKSLQLILGDGYFLDDGVLKFSILVSYQVLKMVDFFFVVLKKGHDKWFELKVVKEEIEVVGEMVQADGDDGCHVDKLKVLSLV